MKVIHVLLIIIFVLVAILGIKVYKSNQKPEYTIHDIQVLLDKANDIKNYECEIEGQIYKRKDYKIHRKSSDIDTEMFFDYKSNKVFICDPSQKICIEEDVKEQNILDKKIYSCNKAILGTDDISELFDEIKLVNTKNDNIQGIECLKVKLKATVNISGWLASLNENTKKGAYVTDVTLWIDKNNGLIRKIKMTYNKVTKEIEYEYKFNTVKDEDVIPDLTGYKKVIMKDGKIIK